MPQMAPINWLILMMMFTTIFVIFNVINYFTFSYKIKMKSTEKTKVKVNWKW
nr:ATP synthase F0 subunit 8 [Phlyctenosis sp. N135]